MRLQRSLLQGDHGGLDGQFAAVRHGVASIDDEIEDYLFDLMGIGHDNGGGRPCTQP